MANSDQLRKNQNQHIPKNTLSKNDDKKIHRAMLATIDYLSRRLGDYFFDYELVFAKDITFEHLINNIKNAKLRKEYDTAFNSRKIIPDGGIIFLRRKSDDQFTRIVLIAEVKRQGTNDRRRAEGKTKQAQGNAIERLSKNLIGIRAALNNEPITPFVCFGWGCDFEKDYGKGPGGAFVMSKLSMMNEFYPLNKTYVFKKDGSSDKNDFAPVSMYFREEQWEEEEMFNILKEIGETAIRYYLF